MLQLDLQIINKMRGKNFMTDPITGSLLLGWDTLLGYLHAACRYLPDPGVLYRRCDCIVHQERSDPEILQS